MKCWNRSQNTRPSRPIQACFFHQDGSVLTDLLHHNLLLSLFSTPLICLWIIKRVGWWNFKYSEDFFLGRYFEHWQHVFGSHNNYRAGVACGGKRADMWEVLPHWGQSWAMENYLIPYKNHKHPTGHPETGCLPLACDFTQETHFHDAWTLPIPCYNIRHYFDVTFIN